ncbi:formate dehydrogenase accessory sulfurtransferase FdhD [Desulfurispora thermophila]|uniref:formate dehydrogenase accessory sulfurtransferase FdhD n=1 Tax=Desulfurispora thermophila TaxID=265470 RepID=UPI0003701575|nr:formate dehydrogenase accessory sulfurtransferase FdhD [Desulfurispora thermophila]
MSDLAQENTIHRYQNGNLTPTGDLLVREVPLTIFLNDSELATLVCSPGAYKELATGFLLTEGLIQTADDIAEITLREDEGLLWVQTDRPVPQVENFLRRQLASCCGKGRSGLYFVNDAAQLQPVNSPARFTAGDILAAARQLEENARLFRTTGGVHSAALAAGGRLLVMYEDIGRHNAVDKVLGHCLWQRLPVQDKALVLSGRVSSEILIKAVRAGLPAVVSRSAPTALTVELARDLNICLIGFARGERFNVYSGRERVVL